MRYLKLFPVLIALIVTANALHCYGHNQSLVERCNEISIKIEELWGESSARVLVVEDSRSYIVGTPFSKYYELHVNVKESRMLDCILAHELTHAVELERGLVASKWFIEGQADLSCYLLFPDEYKLKGYEEWVSKGFGDLNPYFVGITFLYFVMKRYHLSPRELWSFSSLNDSEVFKYFAEALDSCVDPFHVCPGRFTGVISFEEGGWGVGNYYSGNGLKVGSIIVLKGKGSIVSLTQPLLPTLFLRRRRRAIKANKSN